MIRARTTEEYIHLVEEAIYETEELRVAAEYDMESMGAATGFVDDLEASLRELYNSMKEGLVSLPTRTCRIWSCSTNRMINPFLSSTY